MNPQDYPLKPEERVLFALRGLYQQYGYSPFKMGKFEEYDLYVRNKDFLVSDGVITFTDTDGRLMALKPDVTLSIIKNTREAPGCVQKLCYSENVYRISGSTRCFKEIMQTGLECIGDVDLYNLCEVITLAAESLRVIDERCVLDLSHMGVVAALVDALAPDAETREQLIGCIGQKNAATIVEQLKIPADRRVSQLTDAEVLQIREMIDRDFLVEGDLRREVGMNIKRLMDLGCYRGLRHRRGLPVRGQRTHTNARTRKGPAKAIAGKKK